MKFVCDKCKTRYSIGEDRVRGKILKIRCKNCASVITVREGMDQSHEPNRTGHATMAVPLVDPNMLAPNALQEEWYVSIDGVQTGPLSLQAAQSWIKSKPFDAELHCWNEGFDDWLPVDKVSHFRNLRQRPAPRERPKTAPPPLPEKPLFAATMAAIEKEASGPAKKPAVPSMPGKPNGSGPSVPSVAARPAVPAAAARPPLPGAKPSTPAMPTPATPPSKPSSPTPARGSGASSLSRPPVTHAASASNKFLAQGAAPKNATNAALADAFGADDANEALTAVNAPAFDEEPARPKINFDRGISAPASAPVITPAPVAPAPVSVKQALEDDDDSLAIGEVSRVVKLTDLVPKPKASGTGSVAALNRAATSSAGLGQTGSQPRISPSSLGMKVDPALASSAAPGAPSPDDSVVAASFAQKHRRGMMVLIAVAALLVAGVVALVAFVVSKNSDEIGGGFGGTKQIDTSRPEDIVRRQMENPNTGSGSAHVSQNTGRRPIRTNNTTNNNTVIEDPTGNSLQASEIEDMATKQGEGTKRCYMRAQKGAMGFEIADLKKIAVTLSVNKDGTVTDVQLSEHGADSFGQCLIARIKAWKFRSSSSGGTFRISLAFST